jgi:hypothetical protein
MVRGKRNVLPVFFGERNPHGFLHRFPGFKLDMMPFGFCHGFGINLLSELTTISLSEKMYYLAQ